VRELRTEQVIGGLLALIVTLLLLSLIASYNFAAGISGVRKDIRARLSYPDLDAKSLEMIWNERAIDTIAQSIVMFASVAAISLVFRRWLKE